MIRRINLYLFMQILIAFLFSGLAVTFVVLFTQSFRMMSFVIDNSSTMLVFFQLMGLLIPTFLPLIIPISLGISVLFIYHKFVVDSEIVVMRAAGISPLRIALPALGLALFVVLAGYALSIWGTPKAYRALVSLEYQVRDDFSAFMIRPGAFNDLADGLTFYAGKRGSEGEFEEILVHDVRNKEHPITVMAEKGQLLFENNVPRFIVFNGRRQEVDVETGRLQELNFDRYVVDLHLLHDSKEGRAIDARELPFPDLWAAAIDGDETIRTKGKLVSELHQRLAGPFLPFTFAAIAVTLILAGDFNRRGMTKRITFASIAIIVVQASMIGLVMQAERYPLVVPFLYLTILFPLPICLYFLDAPASVFLRFQRMCELKKKGDKK